MPFAIRVEGLSLKKGYKLLISDLNFEVGPGECVALTGANGVGKTTLLRALAGFAPPHAGSIRIGDDNSDDSIVASNSHYLGHAESLSPSRRVDQELSFQCEYLGGTAGSLAEAVGKLRLNSLLDLEVRMLSAGQKRRLSLARLLMVERPVWLLDEPMSPLDTEHRALLAGMMQAHLSDGGLIVCAVHDPLPFETRELRLTRAEVGEVVYG
ncbi:heme ABC exporter ATP-binding protein CcmA [Asticcacaulis sp. BYS171W]|uniref:Heme ABC exporter ATP-binding protein CcmA n=1 Tax=Asticcacaulis aquaticus TaxID=2984212 RepID=A0ABT5HY29_9CAUL|nr:heme ABC exporter ATP-binding protein CcmA [Asticcacaulis aquaticus]MDC7684987.1 heme ABC exporter ATP-binding protein CcmA [Asticcacaulis aquaticus]